MSKNYTQSTASLQAVTVDTHILDANKILIYPGTGERSERTNILEIIKNNVPEDLEARIETIEDIVSGNYAPSDFTTNTSGKSNETEGIAIQYSKKHFLPENSMIQSVSLPYTGAVYDLTDQYCHLYYYNAAGTVITTHISEDKQSRTKNTTGVSTWTFSEDCIIPAGYSYVRVCMSGSENPVSFGSTSKYRINVVNINGVTFDDDECCTWKNASAYDNYLGDISVVYGELTGNITEQLRDINDKIEYLESNSGTDFAKKSEVNTFTGTTNIFNRVDVSPDSNAGYIVTLDSSGVSTYRDVFAYNLLRSQQGIKALPLNTKTITGEDAYGISVTYPDANGGKGGLQLWGTHFMQGDEWSENALKIVHNELALFGDHQAPCSLTFDNANVVNFRVMPNDGSAANGGQGAIFDFQGWQWDNDSHTTKNANCPVQILKNNAGELVDRSLLNKSELDARYAQLHSENTLTETNTFEKTIIAEDGINATSGDIVVTEGVITFEDLIDGTVIERSGASGYQYVEGMPTSFENGVCYDIGEISNTTNLTNVKFTGEGRLVQTCELWFATPATPPTTHQWPKNIYWIDSATGAAPTLIASKNYRIVFRREPNKIIASIAYLY